MTAYSSPITRTCAGCGTELADAMTACPSCGRLVHGDRLQTLAATARDATASGDSSAAMAAWREALTLLPPGSRQYEIVANKITELGQGVASPMPTPATNAKGKSVTSRIATATAAFAAMAWKLKALLLGLTKGTTLFSMLLSLGVYWSIWGWKFALGIVLSIYVHEMGHVIALRRLGFPATAPMFIPGLGAVIRLKQQVVNPREDAEIGLAGPIYGLGAAIAATGLWRITGLPIFAAVAGVGAWINLFNLLPFGTLDGGRGFHAMSRVQKLIAAATVGAAWFFTRGFYPGQESVGDGLLIILALLCLGRAIGDRVIATPRGTSIGNNKATLTYVALVILLTALSLVRLQAGRV